MSLKKNIKLFYKSIIVFIFKVYFGKIQIDKRNIIKIFSKKINIQNFIYKIYNIKDCRIYTNTNDIAVIKNNFILPGPSVQIRNSSNGSVRKNVVFKEGTPKIYKKINKRVFSLLTGTDSNNNYYHWFFDCLPKIYFFKKNYNFKTTDFFLVPNYLHSYQKESLRILGIKNILNAYHLKHFQIKELIITSFTNFNDNPPFFIIDFLRKNFLKKKFLNTKKQKNKIFLNRLGDASKNRDIFNKKEILKIFIKKGFKIVDTSKLSLIKQIKLFNSAKYIAGVHGASFVNVIFCKKNTKVLELVLKKSKINLYKNISKKAGLIFSILESENTTMKITNRHWDGHLIINNKKLLNFLV